MFITRDLGGKSAKFMVKQQRSLAYEEGFIEEMMDGQKVVQVFNHEQAAKEEFLKVQPRNCLKTLRKLTVSVTY